MIIMKKKGITPIISIIILLGITVALAGLAWTVLYNYIGGYTEKNFQVDFQNGVYCITVGSNNTIRVYARNTGTSTLIDTDFSIIQIDGKDTDVGFTGSIQSGKAGFIIDAICPTSLPCDTTTAWAAGSHTIDIATESGNIKHFVVNC